MSIKNGFIAGLFFFFFCLHGAAQNSEKQPLHRILLTLEQRYHVTFTFADDNIEGVFVVPPSGKLDFAEALSYLERSTGLVYAPLNERFIVISVPPDNARGICGTVTFADNGELAAGAAIRCGESHAISDEHGYFYLRNAPPDSLVHIHFMGYSAAEVPARDLLSTPCQAIMLQPQFTTLQSVFVSDFITEGIDKKVDGSLGITASTLGMLPGLTEPDVLQTVQTLPGIQSVNETISDINIRGGTNDQNAILWDGIRIYHSGHFFGLISAFNPYLTEKVTIVKNGSSAASVDGISGTIDIRTFDKLPEKFSGAAGVNMINADALAKVPLSEKSALHLSARRSLAGLIQTPTYDQYFTRAFRDSDVANSTDADTLVDGDKKFYFYDMSLKWLYDITARDKLRLSFLNVYNDIEFRENAVVNNIDVNKTSSLEQHNLGSGISYSRLWSDKVKTHALLYLSSYRLGAVNHNLQTDQRLIQENSVLDTGLKLDARIDVSDKVGLFTGYQFFEVGVGNLEDVSNPSFRRFVKKVNRSHAVFTEADLTFGQTSLRLGVRGNYYPRFKKILVEPRLSFNHNFLRDFYFEVLAEMKHQSSTQIIDLQSDFLGVEKRRWVLSNDRDIPIIESRQLSAGFFYKKNDLLISVEGFYKRVNGILTSSQGFQNQFEFVRSDGSYESMGIDFLTSKKLGTLTTWLSYSHADNFLEFKNLLPPRFPGNLDIRHRAAWGCSVQLKHIELSTGLNWHTGKPFTRPVTGNEVVNDSINYSLPNSSRLDKYLRIDISAKYRFVIGDGVAGEVGASLWNLTDRQNVLHEYYNLNDNGRVEAVKQYSLGLTSNVLFRVVF